MVVGARPTRASRSSRAISAKLALALSRNLKTEGYVVDVDRGDEAVQKLADAPPDLGHSRLDIVRHVGAPVNLYPALRACEATRMLPIIMLSTRGEEVLAPARLFRWGG